MGKMLSETNLCKCHNWDSSEVRALRGFMQAKHSLMIAILSLMGMAEAQHVSDPSLQRV